MSKKTQSEESKTPDPAPTDETQSGNELPPATEAPSAPAETVQPGPVGAVSDGIDPDAPWGRKADGTPRRKPGARKKDEGSGTADPELAKAARRERLTSVTPKRGESQAPTAPTIPIGTDYQSLGTDAAFLWIGVGQMLFGDDWVPEDNAEGRGEKIALREAFAAYFQAKQIGKLPPEINLVVVLGAYTAKRATRPAVASKIRKGLTWIKEQTLGRILRRS